MKAAERPAGSLSDESGEPANHTLYQEYVRGFDEVPVLEDAVSIPPRRTPPPNFVHGERPSLGKEDRADGYVFREATRAEIEALYGEYVAPKSAKPKRKPPRRKKKASGSKRRPKSSAAA